MASLLVMHPDKTATQWGAIAPVTTILTVLVGLWAAFAAVAMIPSSYAFAGDFALYEHVCTTVPHQDIYDYEDAFGAPDAEGVRSAALGEAFCKPFDAFEHPVGARLLVAAETWTIAIPALILLLGCRRIIRRTRDEGPFSAEAVRLLDGSRWPATGIVAVAVFSHWTVQGVANDLVAGASWPDLPPLWLIVLTYFVVKGLIGVCQSGIRQSQSAYERGLAAPPPARRTVD